ncbi:Helicase C-terminal [Penicillium malachiteum]|uniref:Helicase C-terminal n=1 Tax=Penicillium malachiteum TaxID=1324776 RepID=UPI002548642D|nr:Helicase C-terminal [Penicillium malachiteum]KAJ5737100.1 Helicase C-terminal [Penicillium malachiteum]
MCLQLLGYTFDAETKHYTCSLLPNAVNSQFYHYQLSGAVGAVMKLTGLIDLEPLIKYGMVDLKSQKAEGIREAARHLESLKYHGAILADETGFGKTKLSLLALLLYCILAKPNKPHVLLIPGTLIGLWLDELSLWPYFTVFLSYGDPSFKTPGCKVLSSAQLSMNRDGKFGRLPQSLQYLFNGDRNAGRVIILSIFDTHWTRTADLTAEQIPGESFEPPKYKDGKEIWKKEPSVRYAVRTDFTKKFEVLIVDEAHRVKNKDTRIWKALYLQKFEKTILITATPVFNTIHVSSPKVYINETITTD